jgi:hypothetical protein
LLADVIGEIPDVNSRGLDAFWVATAWALATACTIAGTRLASGTVTVLTLLPWLARFTWFAWLTISGAGIARVRLGRARVATGGRRWAGIRFTLGPRWGGRCFIKTDGFQDFLPQTELGWRIDAGWAGRLRTEFLDACGISALALRWATVSAALAIALAAAAVVALVLITV